jgi:uncharacterized RDD family membrane protein YckC
MYCSKCGVSNSNEANLCHSCGHAFAEQRDTPAPQVVLPASLAKRFVHNIVDSIAMYIFAFAVAFVAIKIFGEDIGLIIGLIALFAYHLTFEAIFQKTLGKVLTGTKVVSVTGEKPSFLALLGRTLARYIPFEPLSFLFYGSYPTKGWHDRLSRTLVVPNTVTPEQVRSINQKTIDEQKFDSIASTILIVVAGAVSLITIAGILAGVVIGFINDTRDITDSTSTEYISSNDILTAKLPIDATLSLVHEQSGSYYYSNDYSYEGFCQDIDTKYLLSDIEYTCNDTETGYAITSPIDAQRFFCIDSLGSAHEVSSSLGNEATCSNNSN